MNYQYIVELAKEIEIPSDGILTRTIYQDQQVKAVLFGFDAGQELSEHTASMPAILSIIQGEAKITLGEDDLDAAAGAWIHMPAELPHSIYTKSPTVMLLLLLKSGKSSGNS